LWAKIFNLDAASFGLEDNFLMYGGDSIQAIKLVRLAQASGMSLTTRDILQNPVLKSLSLKVKSLAEKTNNDEKIRPVGLTENTARIQHLVGSYKIEDVSRATDWQSWAVYTGLLKTRGWTDYLTFDFKGSLDVPQLEVACKALLTNFAILRTVFVVDRRRVLQVVLKNYPFDFDTHESTSKDNVKLISKQVFDEDAASDTMLGEPLVRFSLIKGPDTSRLLMRISHAQYDVISLVSLFSALKDAYRGVELQPSPTFIDFVNFTNENNTVSEPFWRKLLEGSKMTEIIKQNKPAYINVVDTTLKNTIALPGMQSHGITTASLILSAWAIVLSQLSGTSDVVFGCLTSGRHSTMPGVQEVLGPCMNITPVRAQTTASTTVLNFLHEVQSQHLASLSYENVGFRHITEKCTNWAPFTRFSSIVNHVHIEEGMKDLFTLTENLKYDFDVYEPQHDKSDLWLQTKPIGNQIEVELRFSREAIPSEVAEKAMQLFCDVVQQAAAAFEKPLSMLIGNNKFTGSCPSQSLLTQIP
jgi:aryl carrier-like protein